MSTQSAPPEFPIRLLDSHELSIDSPCQHFLAVMEPSAELQAEENFDLFTVSFSHNKNLVSAHLAQQGALLLRNFPLENTANAEQLLKELKVRFDNRYFAGASPRSPIGENFLTSAHAPDPQIISLHTEMCYLRRRPSRVFFYCQIAPEKYGETPIFDTAATYALLTPKLKEKLERLGLMYQRYFCAKGAELEGYRTWMDAFNASCREEVAKACAIQRMTFEWQQDGGLLTRMKTSGVVEHPDSGDKCLNMILFNSHAAQHDMSCFKKRYGPLQRLALGRTIKSSFTKDRVFLRTLWGDGTEISKQESKQIIDAAWKTAALFKWQRGDLLLVDNIRCGHGRMNVVGPRSIAVALADPYQAI